jgi:hypothetical protein
VKASDAGEYECSYGADYFEGVLLSEGSDYFYNLKGILSSFE